MRHPWIPATLLVASAVLVGAVAIAAEPVKSLKGEVAAVDVQQKTVTVKVAGDNPSDEKELSLKVDAKTQITKSGQRIELSALRSGDAVVVSFHGAPGSEVAVSIGVQAGGD